MNHVVIGADGTPGADAAVREGLELARCTGAHVTFVYVREAALADSLRYGRKLVEQRAEARRVLAEATAEAELVGVESDFEIAEGDAVEEILRTARYREADLVVVGSRRSGAIAGGVLGSVTRALLEDSPIPVLVTKEKVGDPAAAELRLVRTA